MNLFLTLSETLGSVLLYLILGSVHTYLLEKVKAVEISKGNEDVRTMLVFFWPFMFVFALAVGLSKVTFVTSNVVYNTLTKIDKSFVRK